MEKVERGLMRKFTKILFFPVLLIGTTTPFAAWAGPQMLPIDDPRAASFDEATFNFRLQQERGSVTVVVHMEPFDANAKPKLKDIVLSYKGQTILIDHKLVDDLETPDLFRLQVSTLRGVGSETIVTVYVLDQSANCGRRNGKPCGVVEYNWIPSQGIKKVDFR